MRPSREPVRQNGHSYFVSSQTAGRKPFFRHERWTRLFLDVLESYRTAYQLHAYTVMPDHIHLLLTPVESLEKAVQLVKGSFAYRAKREFSWSEDIWQKGFSDHRIRDMRDWNRHIDYILMNPVRARICFHPDEYPYTFRARLHAMDPIPQRLKSLVSSVDDGGAEAPPLQGEI